MNEIRNDSYQEMKALLNERLDSITGKRSDEEQNESGLKKWGKRAAVGALAVGGAVGAAYGGRKALGHMAKKNPTNAGLRKAYRRSGKPLQTARAGVRKLRMGATKQARSMGWKLGGMKRSATTSVNRARQNVSDRVNQKQLTIPGL